jgi:hypothetical protein
MDVIRKGRIPLIRISDRGHGRVKLQIIERELKSRYIAISHVRTDGLGSPRQNSLPHCQLQRLVKYFRDMPWPNMLDPLYGQVGAFADIRYINKRSFPVDLRNLAIKSRKSPQLF